MSAVQDDPPAQTGRVIVVLLVMAILLGVLGFGCTKVIGGNDDKVEIEATPVRIVYVLESSWFATTPETIDENLKTVRNDMVACAADAHRACEVMVFAALGGAVSALRVPSRLGQDEDTGYWYALDSDLPTEQDEARAAALGNRAARLTSEIADEIVPASYGDQSKGCVNLIDNLGAALNALDRRPAQRNIVKVFATGISNCQGQPFYPDRPFPTVDEAVDGVIGGVPEGSARLGPEGRPTCFEWHPMFGVGVTAQDIYISQEQKQVLKASWTAILDRWGAVLGNEPGEQLGDCLVMDLEGL